MLTGLKILEEVNNGRIIIDPFNEKAVNDNSYNVRLDNEITYYDVRDGAVLDMKENNPTITETIPNEGIVLYPDKVYLAHTVENVTTNYYVPKLDGRSSIARLGLQVHLTAGFGDVGFSGRWTFELHVIEPLRIYPFVEIGQIYFDKCDGDITLYGAREQSKYNGATGTEPSKLYQEFENGYYKKYCLNPLLSVR